MRDNWLSNRIFKSCDDILDHCCFNSNKLVERPWLIMSIGTRQWAHEQGEHLHFSGYTNRHCSSQMMSAPGSATSDVACDLLAVGGQRIAVEVREAIHEPLRPPIIPFPSARPR